MEILNSAQRKLRQKTTHRLRRSQMAWQYYLKPIYQNYLKWIFASNEASNFTYDLSDLSMMYLENFCYEVVLQSKTKHKLSISQDLRNEIKSYVAEIKSNVALQKQLESAQQNLLNIEADFSPKFGRRIGWYVLVRALKPLVLIETGVDKGLGSVILCEALIKNGSGTYIGTDINPKAGYFLTSDKKYNAVGKVLIGDSIESLNKIDQKIDFFINDSDHSADYEAKEYDAIAHKLSSTGIILGDNAHCSPKLLEFSQKKQRQFFFFSEKPKEHWYPGCGIGISL